MGKTTFASDLYSLGMTLIYLVTGIHPAELTQDTGKVKFDSSKISLGFARWLNTITEPYIGKRYPSAIAALTALSAHKTRRVTANGEPEGLLLNLSPDLQTLEIIYENSRVYPGCLFGLIVFFPIWMLVSFTWGLGVAIVANLFGNIIFPPKPKYRIISLTKHKQVREGFYVQDRQNIEWKNSAPFLIKRVIYSPSYTFNKCLNAQKQIVPGGKVEVKAKLSIAVKHYEITIGELKTKAITIRDVDLWRIGNEVSDFLDLELEIISQTPVIPNEVTV
ncbi:MAG: hypothetical protein AAFO95_13505 [Cyanobacteria bacterium J06600_6]